MTRSYHNKKILLEGLLVICLSFLANWNTILAQNSPDSIPKVNQEQSPKNNKPAPFVAKPKQKKVINDFLPDLAKKNSISFFDRSFKVQQKPLNRKYYNNNIFDIDESDNPFALPLKGRKTKRKTNNKSQKSSSEILSELFATSSANSNSTSNIPQWLIFILLGLLSFMAILIAIYSKELGAIFQAFFSTTVAKNAHRDRANVLKMGDFSSYLLFVFGMGTFCFVLTQVFAPNIQFNSIGALMLCILGIAAIYVLKHTQLKIISVILPCPQEIDSYNFIISNTNKILAYLLVPLLFFVVYSPPSAQLVAIYSSLGVLGLVYCYRSLKGLAIAGNIILFHKFHFFMYLCAVEIAPILILLKLLSIL